jgi:hypothetical protein
MSPGSYVLHASTYRSTHELTCCSVTVTMVLPCVDTATYRVPDRGLGEGRGVPGCGAPRNEFHRTGSERRGWEDQSLERVRSGTNMSCLSGRFPSADGSVGQARPASESPDGRSESASTMVLICALSSHSASMPLFRWRRGPGGGVREKRCPVRRLDTLYANRSEDDVDRAQDQRLRQRCTQRSLISYDHWDLTHLGRHFVLS